MCTTNSLARGAPVTDGYGSLSILWKENLGQCVRVSALWRHIPLPEAWLSGGRKEKVYYLVSGAGGGEFFHHGLAAKANELVMMQ